MTESGADDQKALADLRRESEALRRIAPPKRKGVTHARRTEYKGLISKALASSSTFEDVARELDPFPPMLVGEASASAWQVLDAERRARMVQRIRSLDAERQAGEGLPMAMQLLREPATAATGAEILSALKASEKTAQRLANDLFGGDGIPMSHLRAPETPEVAASLWNVLFKTAMQDKAQPWRRLQFLKLVLPWLSEEERSRRPESHDLINHCRQLSKHLDSTAQSTLEEELAHHESWRRLLGAQDTRSVLASPAPASAAVAAPQPERPSVQTAQISATASAPSLASAPSADRELLSVDEARSTLIRSRDRHEKEMRAIDRLLGATRAADAQKANFDADVRHLREQLRRQEVELDSLREDVQRLRAASVEVESRRDVLLNEVGELRARVQQLADEGNAKAQEIERLREAAERDRSSWAEHRTRLESQVVRHADTKQDEFKQRVGRKLDQLTRDLYPRKAALDGNTVAAVLNTRLHEVLDLLTEEGLPIRARD